MWRGRSPFDHDRLRQERGRRLRRPLTTTVLVQSAQPPAASRQPPAAPPCPPRSRPQHPRPLPTTTARTPRKTIVRLVSPGPYIQFTGAHPAG